MKKSTVLMLSLFGLLHACSKEQAPLNEARSSMELVSVVLYYSDGDFDLKTTGEKVLLNTGELVTVPRNVIRPEAALMTSDWNNKFLPAINLPPSDGSTVMKLDRTNGILCNSKSCAQIYSICPHFPTLKAGAKCHSYPK